MTPLLRYSLLQVPDAVLVALVLYAGVSWERVGLPKSLAILLWVLWLLKDVALYPWLKKAYEGNVGTGTARLIGVKTVVHSALDPIGFLKIDGTLWRARARERGQRIEAGCLVKVIAAEGLTLHVVATEEEPSGSGKT